LTLGYQYVRQSLPDAQGLIHTFESVLVEEDLNLDYPFGALVEDIQLEFKAAAAMLRLMGVSQREAHFRTLVQSGLPLQV
jgi:hypothetical protein